MGKSLWRNSTYMKNRLGDKTPIFFGREENELQKEAIKRQLKNWRKLEYYMKQYKKEKFLTLTDRDAKGIEA